MTDGTRRKIVVSTLAEAEFFAAGGFDDIIYGKPVIPSQIPRCKKLQERCTQFHLLFENEESFYSLERTPLENKKWTVFLEVDIGGCRTGVPWDSERVIELARLASQAQNVEFKGIYSHSAVAYTKTSETALRGQAKLDTQRVMGVCDRIRQAGIAVDSVGLGDTPSCSVIDDSMANLTEVHPGNYVFYDTQQCGTGSCTMDDIAVRVATRVISHKPEINQIVTDSGFVSLSHDGLSSNLPNGIAVFQDHPELRLQRVTQEHGCVSVKSGDIDCRAYPLDSMLFIYPYHACATAANHPVFYVHSGDKVLGTWKPVKGW
ncbi:D-serine dehydratase-like isoform X2 [Ostrea edulis]|nr:D-serine dehydratase-like isoform X2 [Ostrea edulis]